MASKDSIAFEVALCAGGLVLMLLAHFLGLLAWNVTKDAAVHVPYWWSYLILFPAAAVVVMRFTDRWLSAAACICAPPVVYFLALGVLEGEWRSSDGALWGAIGAFVVTALVARQLVRRPAVAVEGRDTPR